MAAAGQILNAGGGRLDTPLVLLIDKPSSVVRLFRVDAAMGAVLLLRLEVAIGAAVLRLFADAITGAFALLPLLPGVPRGDPNTNAPLPDGFHLDCAAAARLCLDAATDAVVPLHLTVPAGAVLLLRIDKATGAVLPLRPNAATGTVAPLGPDGNGTALADPRLRLDAADDAVPPARLCPAEDAAANAAPLLRLFAAADSASLLRPVAAADFAHAFRLAAAADATHALLRPDGAAGAVVPLLHDAAAGAALPLLHDAATGAVPSLRPDAASGAVPPIRPDAATGPELPHRLAAAANAPPLLRPDGAAGTTPLLHPVAAADAAQPLGPVHDEHYSGALLDDLGGAASSVSNRGVPAPAMPLTNADFDRAAAAMSVALLAFLDRPSSWTPKARRKATSTKRSKTINSVGKKVSVGRRVGKKSVQKLLIHCQCQGEKAKSEESIGNTRLLQFKGILADFVWFAIPGVFLFYPKKLEEAVLQSKLQLPWTWSELVNINDLEKTITMIFFVTFLSIWILAYLMASLGGGRKCISLVGHLTLTTVLSVIAFVDYGLYKSMSGYTALFATHWIVMAVFITIIWMKYVYSTNQELGLLRTIKGWRCWTFRHSQPLVQSKPPAELLEPLISVDIV